MKITIKNQGFTIIELMVAMAVLAFGILGFMFMQGRATQGRTFSREMTRATIVAQSQVESLLALDFDNGLLGTGSHPTAGEDTVDGSVDGQLSTNLGNFIYQTSWVVTGSTSSKLKSVIVTTQWQIKDPVLGMQTKSISLTTMAWTL